MQKKQKLKLTKFEKWFRFLHRLIKAIYPCLRYKKHGHLKPYNDRAYIFVSNHFSLFDVIITAIASDKPIHFLAKKELFEKGFTKWFTSKSECIPVERDGNDLKAVVKSMKYLKNGENIAIFPEGTRNKTKEQFLPFKSGATAIAIKCKTPIVPIVQIRKFRLFRKNHAIYGEPIELTEYYDKKLTDEDLKKCDDILLKKMKELHAELCNLLENRGR